MRRPIALNDDRQTPVNWVNNVQYGPSNELKQMDYRMGGEGLGNGRLNYQGYYTETRVYNSRVQMTRLTTGPTGFFPVVDREYRQSATQNNGQITQQKDWTPSSLCDPLPSLLRATPSSLCDPLPSLLRASSGRSRD